MQIAKRLSFAASCAVRHLLISIVLAAVSAAIVLGLWYPTPYRALLGVTGIFLLILIVDVICGPLLTLIVGSPEKSRRERILDLIVIGTIQLAALAYGMHSVWTARPVVLAFERDRLMVVTANEVDKAELPKAPEGLRNLPFSGVMKVGTRRPATPNEMFESVSLSAAGSPPAMRPGWWVPWAQQVADIKARAKPLMELIARRPQEAQQLRDAAKSAGADPATLVYLPLTSSKVREWVVLLDADVRPVGFARVDGF